MIIGVVIDDCPFTVIEVRQVGGIIGITDTALRGRFGSEAVQVVIGAGDGAGERVNDLDQPVSGIVGISSFRR